jgi:S1-C subfamily serine protease
MANKVIIGILVLLVLLAGGTGYYSYTLNERIDNLNEQLGVFQTEQTTRVNTLSEDLARMREETSRGISSLEGQIEESQAGIDALEAELGETGARIATAESEIGGITAQVEEMDERISSAETDISQSIIDAGEVYEKISRATVRISNGASTVGSGFIYDNEGNVITASHVVKGLTEVYVVTYEGLVSRASKVSSCQFSDVAVLKLEDNPGIEPPPMGDSSTIRIGEPVIAVGSPLDLRDTLTAGIISQVNRFAEIGYNGDSLWVANLLQFDAAVNAGNSGCPLANAEGEIIGLVIARIYPTEGDGIYYAVAANKFKRVADALIAKGSFDYPWVGVAVTEITPEMVEDRGLGNANGVLVADVFIGSPAHTAGILAEDIITAIDGVPVRNSADLTSYLGEYKSPGDTCVLDIVRGAIKREITVEVGTRE